MYQLICQTDNLVKAFAKVKRNRGGFGVDRISLKQYGNNLARNTKELARLLEQERYSPLPVRQVLIPKANGKLRPFGIPTVRDRVVQQAILEVIQPIFEPIFSPASYGFRPGKSAILAINKVQEYLDEGYEYIVEADIKDFFGQLDKTRLMSKVHEQMKDTRLHKLLWKILRAGVMIEGRVKSTVAGTPQGGVISPILANIYLNDFDHKLERAGYRLVRYADDFVILAKTVNEATSAMKMIRSLIKSMKLELAEEKTQITTYAQGFDFLGYHFRQNYYGKYKWPTRKAQKAFKDKIRRGTRRQQPKNVAMVIQDINPIIRGWGNYFRYGDVKGKYTDLDSWIRMRLRSFIEKKKQVLNWKYPNTCFDELGLVSLTALLKYQTKLSLPD